MSNLYQRTLSLAGIDISSLSVDDLRALVRKILEAKRRFTEFRSAPM